jgi:hypothetical protein
MGLGSGPCEGVLTVPVGGGGKGLVDGGGIVSHRGRRENVSRVWTLANKVLLYIIMPVGGGGKGLVDGGGIVLHGERRENVT